MYTQPEQRAGTGNARDNDINMWQLLLTGNTPKSYYGVYLRYHFCNAGNKIVLSRIDLYSRKRTGDGDDTFRRVSGNNNTDKNDASLPIMTTILLIIEALAWILATDAIKYDKMYFEIRRIKDDSEERTLLLAEKTKHCRKNKIMKFMRQHFVRETELPAKSMIMQDICFQGLSY